MHHLNLIILVYLAKNFLANALVPFGVLKRQRTPNQSLIPNNMMVSSSTSANNSNDHIVHRYESPFFPSKIANRQSTSAALIILNTPIHTIDKEENCELPAVLKVLWESSTYRICADGGANRLYEATVANQSISTREKTRFLPDLITGDLDSLLPHVREFYEGRGVPVVQIIDQDYHDLDKSLMGAEKWIDNMKSTTDQSRPVKTKIFIYGGFGGRFDQEMGCINALYVWGQKEKFQRTSMAVYGEETCAFVLPPVPASNEIRIRFPKGEDVVNHSEATNGLNSVVGEGPTCGLIPLGARCEEVCTTGLKWNLNGDVPLEFGGIVSSSNRVMDGLVTVKTSSPLLFTTEMITKKL